MKDNLILLSDAYKCTHHLQTPPKTEVIYSYLESRGGRFPDTVVFGLQYYLKRYLAGPVIEQWMIEEADEVLGDLFGVDYFNRAGWQKIVDVHGGRLPVRIKAVREGMVIPGKNIIISMENTDDELPWVTNFFETILMNVWYPITVATLSFNIKQIITDYAKKTSDIGCTPYHLNDFGARSVSSPESAGIGGMAHLVNFAGTDTLNGVRYARHYYDAGKAVAASVFATEHSTTTSWTREHEIDAYEHFLDACPEGICSVVADSYNIYEAVKMFGTTLKEKVLARGSKTGFAKLVIRPDSGEPAEVSVKVLQLLDQYFGSTLNSKGYKILNPKVGMIYGDGINDKSIKEILDAVVAAGFSTDNIVFGMGGELLQGVKRDDLKFAFKCAEAKINNEWVRVYKDPITDPGKVSKKGRLALIKDGDTIRTIEVTDAHKNAVHAIPDLLELVFENGEILREYTFADVRALTETFIK